MSKQKIHIDLNRKLMSHYMVGQLRDTAKSQGMLSGSAIMELIDEYDKMRYLCEALVTAYEKNKTEDMKKVIELLGMIL